MSRLRKDENAVEGIPLNLIIVALILAIAIPIVWAGFENYDRSQTESNVRSEIEFVITTIKFVYTGGEGNSQSMDVNLRSGFTTKIQNVKIGDNKDGLYSSIRYKLSNSKTKTVIIDNPNIPVAGMTESGPDALDLREGRHTLLFTAKSDLDFDDDGRDDLYVEVQTVK